MNNKTGKTTRSKLKLVAWATCLAWGCTLLGHASVIVLTGGDAVDASDGIGYTPTGTLVYAYRMTVNPVLDPTHTVDQSAYTYRGITFQPFTLNGWSNSNTPNTTHSPVSITDGFFYLSSASNNTGSGGGAHSSDDTTLFDVAHYMSFAAATYTGSHGTETVVLGGLTFGRTYQVDLLAANPGSGTQHSEYLYTMTGATGALPTDDVFPSNNIQLGVVYDVRENVKADVNGQITISLTDNHNLTADNAVLSAFSVELLPIPEPVSVALLALGGLIVFWRCRVTWGSRDPARR